MSVRMCLVIENVYKLAQEVTTKHPNEINKCFVVFISNPSRTDYHVIFLYHPEPDKCLVYDLDSELPFPTYVHKYVTETFRTDHILKPDYFRYFRVIPANEFLSEFASDRRHMKRPNVCAHNLEDYIQMDTSKGPGQVLTLTQFVQRFYKPST
ncbi:unnamed protein product [Callosobruchus maculatus]|uniref:Protein N-terminal glutamine amidohydrolase n=1 Tax=Callosobruchus maculatus TaxID=64391 RepID=A0A653BQ22_CALMS|nr:unnamed protein product [Callosobruchus maculatus]